MGILDSHAFTAVTAIINRAIDNASPTPDDALIEMELPELLIAIGNQHDLSEPGPVEAARAIRKKLKYGNYKQQYNALKLYELLVANGDSSMNKFYNDRRLLERMKYIITMYDGTSVDPRIFKTAKSMAIGWNREYSGVTGREGLASLLTLTGMYKPKKNGRRSSIANGHGHGNGYGKKPLSRKNSVVPDFMNDTPFDDSNRVGGGRFGSDDEDDVDSLAAYEDASVSSVPPPTGSTGIPLTNKELDKKFHIPKINYDKETPKIFETIAKANVMATGLTNTLTALGKDELSIHSPKANDEFEDCRQVRRKILTYLQLVNKEELLGVLLKCNDELVAALKLYEAKSVPDDDDIDSLANYETDDDDSLRYGSSSSGDDNESERHVPSAIDANFELPKRKVPPPIPPKTRLASSKVQQKPKQQQIASEDSDNPFGDDKEADHVIEWR
ncbi:unnamed protein product [Ambrosiozyma monospora]|uniref:Unnamed protein product n=1 Tax=Ambrosiozyma monospora TaxID=43982 RepID=A0A9W6YRN2_AMBMO|nr:unnamed protein product [Ambrosiozyma monospora]